ncbi:MAG: M20/M25/M40 family metallo-hydrolase [Candidatus Woesearchaeota archaeon]
MKEEFDINLLEKLLVDSYSGDYSSVISIIIDYLKKYTDAKIIIQKDKKSSNKKANIIVIFGKPKLMINCHMDTVSPSGIWKKDPLNLYSTKSKFYGLGTADTKGNIYSVLSAVKNTGPKNLMLLFSFDEEIGSGSGANAFLKSKYNKGIKNSIVCEPTSLEFINMHPGYYSFYISVKSKPHHSSIKKEQENENAIAKAAELILKFAKDKKYSFNIGTVNGGTSGNTTASVCKIKISVRSFDPIGKIKKEIYSKLKGYDGIQLKDSFVGEPFKGKHIPFLDGKKSKQAKFWSEAALFQKSGINSIVFGAGNIKQAHTNDEYVLKKHIIEAQKVFENIIGGLE